MYTVTNVIEIDKGMIKLTCVTKLDMSKIGYVLVKFCAVLLFIKDINYNS